MPEISPLPECMQPGWDPLTPGREMRSRTLTDAAAAREAGDIEEAERLAALALEEW